MRKIKKMIILLLIVVIIIFICISILNKNLNQNKNEEKEFTQTEADITADFIKDKGEVDDYITFFSVEKMLNNYINNIRLKNAEGIYSLLDNTYIAENNITIENILKHVENINNYDSNARIRKMYQQQNIENGIYYIDSILEKDNQWKQYYFVLYEDKQNLCYSVAQISKEVYEKNIKKVDSELQEKEIQRNEYNKAITVYLTEEEIANRYFEDILENMLYYPEYAYNMLSIEYRDICFPSLQDFKDYIENRREIISSYDETKLKQYGEFENMEEYLLYLAQTQNLELKEYQIRRKEYNRYICIDNLENYYIFYAVAPLNYIVMLDNYTIPTSEFAEEYSKQTEAEKVVLNIKKFFMGIDDKNYGYSYSVLSESFKNNKYPTKNEFINYVKQNFFEENKIEYITYEKENGAYIYKIKIKDATGKSTEEKTLNMILKLKDGTDFEMSFGE